MDDLCLETYVRPEGASVVCTYLNGHASDHSWAAVREKDERGAVPRDIDVLIENIAGGTCDPYLEAILAATHGRKRALRGSIRPYGVRDPR